MKNLRIYNRKLKDWMGGFEVIHSFQVEDEVKKRFAKSVEDVEKRRYEGRRYQNPYGILTLLLTYLILSIQLVVSAYLVFIGSISERMLLEYFLLILQCQQSHPGDCISAFRMSRQQFQMQERWRRFFKVKTGRIEENRGIGKISHAVGVERGTYLATRKQKRSYMG